VGPLLQQQLGHGQAVAELLVLLAYPAQRDVRRPRAAHAVHAAGDEPLQRREEREQPALEQGGPVAHVHLLADGDQVPEHQAGQQQAALVGCQATRHVGCA
jgi:hypothetical protein